MLIFIIIEKCVFHFLTLEKENNDKHFIFEVSVFIPKYWVNLPQKIIGTWK